MKLSTLDLHAASVDEATTRVDAFLMQQTNREAKRARIMTGKGTGAVQKAVIAYLKRGHYPWEYERMDNGKRNEGVLVVILE